MLARAPEPLGGGKQITTGMVGSCGARSSLEVCPLADGKQPAFWRASGGQAGGYLARAPSVSPRLPTFASPGAHRDLCATRATGATRPNVINPPSAPVAEIRENGLYC